MDIVRSIERFGYVGKVGIQESAWLFGVSLEKRGLCDRSSRYQKVYKKMRL